MGVQALGKSAKAAQPTKQQQSDATPAGSEWQEVKKVAETISEKILNEQPSTPILIMGGNAKQAADQDAFCNQTCRLFWEFLVVFLIAAKLFADKLRAKLAGEGQMKLGEEKSRFDKTLSMLGKKTGLGAELNDACHVLEMVEKGGAPASETGGGRKQVGGGGEGGSAGMWGAFGNSKRWALLGGSQGQSTQQQDAATESQKFQEELKKPKTTEWKHYGKEQSRRELAEYQKEQQSLDRKVAEMKQMLEALQAESPDDASASASTSTSVSAAAPAPSALSAPAAAAPVQSPWARQAAVLPAPGAAAVAAAEAEKNAVSVLKASEMDLVDALCDMTDSEDEED